ncbi:metallophosphoesterase family protein [Flavobacterium sp.]|uniref:metallophosphoesterase family protein n=1 Tax=Flavobacterium sp. TaxID=239 RepID=UPI003D6B0F09
MKRTLVIGDIHGGLKALTQVLERANVTLDDTLVFLGDYVDGWSESAQTIEYLLKLAEKQECIFIRGNHDLWCGRWLELGASNPVWEENGGKETKQSYLATGLLTDKEHIVFFNQLKDYYIDGQNRLFIHAGYTSIHGVGNEEYPSNYYFDRTLWEMALVMDDRVEKHSSFFPKRLMHYKEIFLGHTPTVNFGKDIPMHAINIWNVDTGAGFKGKLSCLDIETKQFWQSDSLPTIYTNEKGRN